MARVPKLLEPGQRRHGKSEQGLVLLGVDLQDAREEVFVRMIVDGIAIGIAFKRAGFTSKNSNAPSNLWALPRIQERAAAILEARRNTGVVTLPEVTGMLQRVFSSAYHADEYNAAHNAALSLARLYGHVNDRQTLEVIRRPSRDPDAPSEQELSSWVEALPGLAPPDQASFLRIETPEQGSNLALPRAPAPLLSAADAVSPTPADNPATPRDSAAPIDWGLGWGPASENGEKPNNIKGSTADILSAAAAASDSIACDMIGPGGRPENGAPSRPVTGTPNSGGRSAALKPEVERVPRPRGRPKKKRVPPAKRRVPVKKGEKKPMTLPSAKDLFG